MFFNRLAEIVAEYLHKGSKIYVEGSLRTRKWQDKNGIERHTTEIIANEMHMLSSKTAPHGNNNNKEKAMPLEENVAHTNSAASTFQPPMDDDIPF